MPPVVVIIAAALVEIGVSAVIATFIAQAIVSFVVSTIIGAIFSPKAKKAEAPSFTSSARDRTITVRQPAQPHRVIYGEIKVGGTIAFMHSTDNDTHLHMIVVLAGHEVQEIGDIYFNDEIVPLDGGGEATGRYAGYARVIKHLGADSQAADATLMSEAPDKWTAAHRLQGRAYIYIRFIGNSEVYANGLPNISAVVKGKKDIYDPRTATTGYSVNAALCIANYMMDTRYGMGAVYASEIDGPTLIASANVCDEAVALAGGGTEPRYLCNGSFNTSESPETIVGEMLSSMVGKMIYTGGKWLVRAGYYELPTISLSESDARGEIKVKPRISRSSLYNAVKGVFVSPANQWQPADFPAVTNATYQSQDNGERIYRDISLPYTVSGSAAQRIAKFLLEEVRQQIVVEFPAKLVAIKLRAGDTVKLNWARFGWVDKVFRVENFQFELYDDSQGEQALGVGLVLRETASTIADWNSGEQTTIDSAPNTNLPNPFVVGAVSGLSVNSGTAHLLEMGEGSIISRIYVSWTDLPGVFVQAYETQFRRSVDTLWQPGPVVRDSTACYISPVEDGVSYDVRVRATNSIGVNGAYSTVFNHVVVGKTEAPPAPNTFTISRLADGTRRYAWTLADVPADVRSGGGYQIRYKVGATSDWDAMTELHTGLLVSSPLENNELAAGIYTWAIKTIDSSGNASAAANFISGEIGDPRLKNVLLQRLEHQLSWPGTLTGCFKHANILIPRSTTTIAGLPAAISSLASTINAIGTNTNPIVYETPVIDLGANVTFTPLVTVTGTSSTAVPVVTDMFTGTDGTLIVAHTTDSGHTWIAHALYSAGATYGKIQSNRADNSQAGSTKVWFYSSAVPATADYKVSANVYCAMATLAVSLLARSDTTAGDGYELRVSSAGLEVFRINANSNTYIGNAGAAPGVGQTSAIDLEVFGNGAAVVINVYLDGALSASLYDTSTSRILTAGRPGFILYQTAGYSIDALSTVIGDSSVTMKTGTAADGTVVGTYGSLGTVMGKRYVQIKVIQSGIAATIESMITLIDSEAVTDEYEDVNTATASASWFAGTAAGHFKIGSKSGNLAAITSAKIVALQNVGAGWSWELLNKTSTVGGYPAAEFKIYNSSGTLANAVIDVELKGPKI